MLDLSREELIPGKTMGKMRNGKRAIFINDESGTRSRSYRFCPIKESGGSFCVKETGRISSYDTQSGRDIVSIARKWVPKNGDRVGVIGYLKDEAGGAIEPDSALFVIDDRAIDNPPEALIYVRSDTGRHLVLRGQLRRYVLPARPPTLEEPQPSQRVDFIPF